MFSMHLNIQINNKKIIYSFMHSVVKALSHSKGAKLNNGLCYKDHLMVMRLKELKVA